MSPLEEALRFWSERDSLGGFATVGVLLWPGWEAKRVCRAPHREDRSPSFSVYQGEDGKWRFKDHGTSDGGSLVDFVALSGMDIASASRWLIEGAGVASSPTPAPKATPAPQQTRQQAGLDWSACAVAFSDEDAEKLREWRGYSEHLCVWLRENRLIGIYQGCVAFPVHDEAGAVVVGAHYRPNNGSWAFTPKGTRVRPLVFGNLATADQVHVFESQWDALAVRDAFRDWDLAEVAFVITRGASHGAIVAGKARPGATIFVWPQNDPEDKRDTRTGRTPAEKWLDAVCEHAGKPVMVVLTPAAHKDPNDWLRAGATAEDFFAAIEAASKFEYKAPPAVDSNQADVVPATALFPLFRVDHLAARPSERVFVVESEAGVNALETLGLLATTTIEGGSKSVRTVNWAPLAGREVVIMPANGKRGEAYAATVARILTRMVPPAKSRVIVLPGLPSGGGCAEWLDARDAQAPDDIVAELDALIASGQDFTTRADERDQSGASEPYDKDDEQHANPAAFQIVNTIRDIVAKGVDGSRGPSLEKCFSELREILIPSSYPPIVAANEFLRVEPAMPLEIVKGIIHQGSKVVLGGASKTNKTWSLLDLAISVAIGAPWWGRETKQGAVLFANLEVQPEFFWRRIKRLLEAKGVSQPDSLDIWNLRGKSADLTKMLPLLVQAAEKKKYALIIIDPIYKCLGGRVENAAEDVAAMLNEAERIAVATGAAVAFAAHFSKGNQAGKESIDRISGSGVFARDPDTIVTLTKHDQEGAFTVDATLRNFPPIEPFVMKWDWPLMVNAEGLDPKDIKKPERLKGPANKGQALEAAMEKVLPKLIPLGKSRNEWLSACQPMPVTTFDNYRRQLADAGCVKKDGEGIWHQVD